MRYICVIILCFTFLSTAFAWSGDSIKLNQSPYEKFVIGIEGNALKVTSNLNFRSAGLNGVIDLDYYWSEKFYTGLYLMKMQDWYKKDNQYFLIDGKVIDLSTSQFTNYGISIGYKVFQDENFYFAPELRIGYGIYKANSVNFGINNNKNTLELNMWTAYPKVNLGYKICNRLDAGLTGGYFIPFSFSQRVNLNEYDMSNVMAGLFLKLHL